MNKDNPKYFEAATIRCEEYHDTGYGGDIGPGIRGNREYGPCDCDPKLRAERNLKRRIQEQQSIPPEFEKTFAENFWEILA